MTREELTCPHCQCALGIGVAVKIVAPADRGILRLVHNGCFREWVAHTKGLKHRCPICGGKGTKNGKVTARSAEGHVVDTGDGVGRMEYDEVGWEQVACTFCRGEGYLEKEPVPVVVQTGWRHGA